MSHASLYALNIILALMMFGIALNLRLADFQRVVRYPKGVVVGLITQFLALPGLTFIATYYLPLPAEIELGLLLVASCPGGSFSNIMTYLAGGNAALSVTMTALASSLAAFFTPFNFILYSSLNPVTAPLMAEIAVPAEQIYAIVALVLALPLLLGLAVGRWQSDWAAKVEPGFRYASLAALYGFVAIAIWQNWQALQASALIFIWAVIAHNLLALGLGYGASRMVGLDVADRRAVTFEVGLQNSGLGLGIIFTFFADLGGMAIVAAGWGIWHLISGMTLCGLWNRGDRRQSATVESP
ncbi:bile acid:sodium symporter family protein [Pseudidiomarina taiwanensis]|uniref:Bile acid:sodium symporter n=1 Tax=Pseudidiomarina taiwanensis TaxID=337250 RepID=A0A432ZEV0_9GAMM|nr:bile acid:sodium symporter family protein [Pseudidiomarina taiwanensis]RUO76420.1 bile acid:sodium symporter [Pseudidiomarina taiwanensis]